MGSEREHIPSLGRRHRIGVFVEWIADGYSDPIFNEIAAAAHDADCSIVCFVGGLERRDFPDLARTTPLSHADPSNIDGALIVSLGNRLDTSEIAHVFRRLDPLPVCGISVSWDGSYAVEVDNDSGVRQGVRHLIRAHNRQKIACLRGPFSSREANLRFEAYRDTLLEHGLSYDSDRVTTGAYVLEDGVRGVATLLDERRASFDALVCANDAMALGAMQELARRGIAVPDQVSILGFDDIEIARYARPPLSSVRQPMRHQARKAFEVLLEAIEGKRPPKRHAVASELVLRRSCGCLVSHAADSIAPPVVSEHPGESPEQTLTRVAEYLAASTRVDDQPFPEADSLPPAFARAIVTGKERDFLRRAEAVFALLAARQHDVLSLLPAIQELRRRCLGHLKEHSLRANVGELCQSLATIAAEVATHSLASAKNRQERYVVTLVRVDEDLIRATTFRELQEALNSSLPRFNINRCFVCVYGDERDPEHNRLIIASRYAEDIELPEAGLRFPRTEIVPAQYQPEDAHILMMCPMLRRDELSPGYVVFERGVDAGFVYEGLIDQIGTAYKRIVLMQSLVREVELREQAERGRLEREMQIANGIQTGILPRTTSVDGLEIAAIMLPATEVGGDYYDVIPVEGGCWIGIGDVAGHGLPTGLVMMMLQSVLGGLIRSNPKASPSSILVTANELLFDNIRRRMSQDEHITLTLIRYDQGGTLCFAGAHEDILIGRARGRAVEQHRTHGVWLGITKDIRDVTEDSSLRTDEGDVILLHTDGITEAFNARGEMFGQERLAAALERCMHLPVQGIRDAVIAEVQAWMGRQDDDITLFVARHSGRAQYVSVAPGATSG